MSNSILIWDFDGTLGYRQGMWSGALADIAAEYSPSRTFRAEDFKPHLQSGFPWHAWQDIRPASSADAWWGNLEPVFHRAFRAGGGFADQEAGALAAKVRGQYLPPRGMAAFR